jgi:hypothetical protein
MQPTLLPPPVLTRLGTGGRTPGTQPRQYLFIGELLRLNDERHQELPGLTVYLSPSR